MSVEIKFEPDGPSGLVAEGTCVLDAAKRLGFHIPADCEGRGECDTCAVKIITGATLLSALTDGERKELSAERLAAYVCKMFPEMDRNRIVNTYPCNISFYSRSK